ncbi:hypothetical protein VNO80_08417 [Phaseolus coccineus]|uniref:1,3-beta-glucan synthase n=1 Tax=Phaseolus coccineus TaxID=3886 RepID=A0AAN9RQK2_PHACN
MSSSREEAGPSSRGGEAPQLRRIIRTQTAGNLGESVIDSEVVPSSLVEIAPILRVANEVEKTRPRVAYLCRFYAFEKAHWLDPNSSGRGVRQFKTAFLQLLERENDPNVKQSDAREMKSFYLHYHKENIQPLQNAARAQLTKAYNTANVLFEVLEAVYMTLSMEVDREIQAAVDALRNTEGLPWPKDYKTKKDEDILDWLGSMFGFQKHNVANQREHLILLLANVHIRQFPQPDQQPKLDERALTEVMNKLFKNYKKWCKYLGRESSILLPPTIPQEVQQLIKLLHTGLYLLIWGEAANLRFMPECLCYIYHHMAIELHGVLPDFLSPMTKEKLKPAYGGEEEAFLRKVVTPIYNVIAKEAARSKKGRLKHSQWRNYDDLNEYFWSADCFQLGWPMRADADFFCLPSENLICDKSNDEEPPSRDKWAMIIVAWNGSGDVLKVLSVFITAAILKFGQAAAWVIVLSVTYSITRDNPPGFTSLFILAVVVYLSPNMLAAIFFLFPFIRRHLERSNYRVMRQMLWWSQPRLYVGRGMHESTFSLFKYTMFWVLLIITKLAFSYYIEVMRFHLLSLSISYHFFQLSLIKPLVGPTKAIMSVKITTLQWPEFFPHSRNNIDVVIALWSPIILIRALGMLRSRFKSLPGAFNASLMPAETRGPKKYGLYISSNKRNQAATFAQLWNQIITSFRDEDLISDREMDLLLVPYWDDAELDIIQWPPFLLAGKIPIALVMAKDGNGKDQELKKRMRIDNYMFCAVRECYASFRNIIKHLVQGERETKVIEYMFDEVHKHIESDKLIVEFGMSALPNLCKQFVLLIEYLLANDPKDRGLVVILFQDMLEVVIRDIMIGYQDQIFSLVDSTHGGTGHEGMLHHKPEPRHQLFAYEGAINFPIEPFTAAWTEKLKRLYLLLTTKESAMDVPSNLEARRRISFLSSSLFMDLPIAPTVRNMLSFSVLTPYYTEEVLFSLQELDSPNEDGVSILFYLQKIFPDEWNNFLQRVKSTEEDIKGRKSYELVEELRLWASYRGQTLTRTGPLSISISISHPPCALRGMMYYRKALELQAFLDMAKDEDLMEGYKAVENSDDNSRGKRSLRTQCQAVADMKFTYVVSCQQYGIDKRSGSRLAQDILRLMTRYPSLRVAYIDEVEEPVKESKKTINKVYYSCLVKAMPKLSSTSEPEQNLDQIIYKIKLPGPAILGEGKPENQNHAIIFTRGEGLQTIDMNQDNYMEEALKMRNLLQEFRKKHGGVRFPSILGLREHIFTGSVSSLAWFMSNQETSFVTIGQRLLANPLKVRFHYGHPDVFDRLFHLTRGGVSKASKVINLSEDIFAGFNSTLREGNITHHEYIQVGKGRDVGLNQISMFEAKIANGNGEQTLSRDVYRLGHRFDFFRMLSCYFTTVGFYFSTLITVLTVYIFLYGRLYLVLSGLEEGLSTQKAIRDNKPLQVALASQSFVQMGVLMALPMLMEIGLERGFRTALSEFILMQLQLAPVFFTFSLGTKTHYFGRTLLHGGAKYRPTGRGFVVFHAKFADNYRLYSRSHFVKGVLPEKSWESWWEEEQEHLQYSGLRGIIVEILLSLRFFIYQYGLVYGISWLVIFVILFVMKMVSVARRKFSVDYQLVFRVIKGLIFLTFVSILVILIALPHMTVQDIVVCILAFMPTGWGMLQIAQALKPLVRRAGLWGSVKTLARGYEIVMGFLLFTPVAFLAWFPFVSEFQTRMLFNQAFSRGPQIWDLVGLCPKTAEDPRLKFALLGGTTFQQRISHVFHGK